MENTFRIMLGEQFACVEIAFDIGDDIIPFRGYSKSLLDELMRFMEDYLAGRITENVELWRNDPECKKRKLPFRFTIDAERSIWRFYYDESDLYQGEAGDDDEDDYYYDDFDDDDFEYEEDIQEATDATMTGDGREGLLDSSSDRQADEERQEASAASAQKQPEPIVIELNREQIEMVYHSLQEQYQNLNWARCGEHHRYELQFPDRPYTYYRDTDGPALIRDADRFMLGHTLEHIMLEGLDFADATFRDQDDWEFVTAGDFVLAFDHGYIQFHIHDNEVFSLRFFEKNEVTVVNSTTIDRSPFGDRRLYDAESLFTVPLIGQRVVRTASQDMIVCCELNRENDLFDIPVTDLRLYFDNNIVICMSHGLDGFSLKAWKES